MPPASRIHNWSDEKKNVEIVWEFKYSIEEDSGVNDKMKSFYKLYFLSNFIGNI
jgi:hypothetical protein